MSRSFPWQGLAAVLSVVMSMAAKIFIGAGVADSDAVFDADTEVWNELRYNGRVKKHAIPQY